MSTDTTPTSIEALAPRYKIGYRTDEWGERSSTPGGIPDPAGAWVRYDDHAAALARAAHAAAPKAAPAVEAGGPLNDAAVQALESIAAMTFDRWSEGYRAGQIAIAALDKLRVQTTEWGPAPAGNEADEPMSLADRLDLMADAQAAGSTAQSDLYAAATVWRKHLRGQPAPTQADSAPGDEAQRGV